MQIQFFCPRWGSEQLDWNHFARKVKEAGYNGIEVGISRTITHAELEEIFSVATTYNLRIIAQQHDTFEADITTHCKAFRAWFEKIKPFSPLFVNSQTGKDFFTIPENKCLFTIADDYTKQTGIAVYHETHRSKCLFAAHVAAQYCKEIPSLQITFDMSHWVCVASSYLHDQPQAMQTAMEKTAHIHARVGYTEGAQVPNPFVPEWKEALAAHLSYWDVIINRRKVEKKPVTITPEFGAFPYMLCLPGTEQPIANQWDLNVKMMHLLKERYA